MLRHFVVVTLTQVPSEDQQAFPQICHNSMLRRSDPAFELQN
jgi:hypothetical protein